MSRDPIAFRHDPDAPGWLRDAFAREAEAHVVPIDAGAGLERLQAAIRAEPPVAMPAPAAAGATSAVVAARWLLGLVVGAGAVGGLVLINQHGAPTSQSRATGHAPAVTLPATPIPMLEPTPGTAVTPPPTMPEPATPALEQPPPAGSARGPAISAAHARPVGRDLEADDDAARREMQNLAETRAALVSDPARALRLASFGQRAFPHGIAGDERESMSILALVRLGRSAEARTRGGAFLAAHPRGIFSERIRQVLADSNGGTP